MAGYPVAVVYCGDKKTLMNRTVACSIGETTIMLLRLALRRLLRAPRFSASIILTLAIGLGANAVVFALLSGVLLRQLPYPSARSLVVVGEKNGTTKTDELTSLPVYLAWINGQTMIRLAAYRETDGILKGAEPLQVKIVAASASFGDLFDPTMALGRSFERDDDSFDGAGVAILSYSLWTTAFKSDSAVIGRTIDLDGRAYTVRGVATPQSTYPTGWQVRVPLLGSIPRDYTRVSTLKFLHVIGRLNDGVTASTASAALGAMASQVPGNAEWGARVVPLRDTIVGNVRGALLVLMAAAGAVLLLACANVGSLQLARGVGRRREWAVHNALGASPIQVAAQLVLESLLLTITAAIVGIGTAWIALSAIQKRLPVALPRLEEVAIDRYVLLFVIVTIAVSTLAIALAPCLRLARIDLGPMLRESAPASNGTVRLGSRKMVVVAEIIVSTMLLNGAGLLLRSYVALSNVDPGFDVEHLTTFEIRPPEYKYQWPAWHTFFTDLQQRVAGIPGVVSVATASTMPLAGGGIAEPVVIAGQEDRPSNASAQVAGISPEYLHTMKIRLIAGRNFTEADAFGTRGVALVSESFARKFFPNGNILGRHVRPYFGGPTLREVIGVVSDVHQTSVEAAGDATLYTLAAQQASGPLTLVVRSELELRKLAPLVRSVLHEVDEQQPTGTILSMEDVRSRAIARPRFYSELLTLFAGVAVLLAAVGIAALMTEVLEGSRREIAVRLVLGANATDVLRLLLSRGVVLVGAGVCAGSAAALLSAKVLSSLLYGVQWWDPLASISALLFVFCTTSLTVFAVARRTLTIDPNTALRG
jgi:putative ABC transport system permease protein